MPIPFTPPLDDIRFVLNRLVDINRLTQLSRYSALTPDVIEAVLTEAGKIASDAFAPLNEIGDTSGVTFVSGQVSMPAGFQEAYAAFANGGWNGLPADSDDGGQGLPWLLAMSVQEMLQAANIGLALCPLLNQGAIELLSVHASADLKKKFLSKLVSGEWTGTMNLTESQAGSDVGAVSTRAERSEGSYRIYGQKIFISYGDHNLASNIIHLVLARLPGAPSGTRGLSLFLVPKFLVNDDGSLGSLNDVRVVSVEHKLGQHSSPTCVMAYGDHKGAEGYLVGQENGGIAAMFTMMNNARISVGIQALGLMERAYQHARDFAHTRIQGRAIEDGQGPLVTIIHHPDVRRMLLIMKTTIEASRALAYSCGFEVDVAKSSENDHDKKQAMTRVDLLTPIVKALLTDFANEVSSLGIQVFGGMGYIEETGAAQYLRDARILAIYEGTNGIQANDLVFRKLARDQGTSFTRLIEEIEGFLKTLGQATDPSLCDLHGYLSNATQCAQRAATWMIAAARLEPARAAASASAFLRLSGITFAGYYLARCALLACEDLKQPGSDRSFLNAKILSAHFYARHTLPQCAALLITIEEGWRPTLDSLESLV